ncbi:unnamed protein product [Anisakis simplex]|uniref:Galectin n=1 Tax=Anisakis simplex TaxID=6269 RepID=A0A0M3J3E5_ANISI|nr:unnamed protein product [Anisakis simplex]
MFLNTPDSIQVFYDGERIYTFKHRTRNPKMDYHSLVVSGDLEVESIEFDV